MYDEILNAWLEYEVDDEGQTYVVVSFGSFEHVFDPEDIPRMQDRVLGYLSPPMSTASAEYVLWYWATN